MLKHFVARLLIISQVYGCFFQGIAHAATLVDESGHQRHLFEETSLLGINEPEKLENFEDVHISKFTHLYSEFNEKLGQLQFSLGDGLTAPTVFTIPTVNDPTDSFNYGGVTVNSQSTYFTFQGLRVSVNKAGIMVVQGSQTEQNPIFLSSNRPIILNDVKASTLSVTSQKIVNTGISAIECLSFEGQSVGGASFINAGQLTSKDLFLNNLNSDNRGTISSTNFGIMGELNSSGVIESDELILGENACLKLDKASRADIKTLFLSKASHLQNHQQEENVLNIGVLHSLGSLGGALTNFGTMAISEVATGSAFQAITNRHFMGIAQGDVKVETFTNSKAFGVNQGLLLVENGTNSGVLNANDLRVKTEFTNNKNGFVAVPLVSGAGEIINQGIIGAHDKDLALDVKNFTNSAGGSVNAKSINGLANLAKFTNAEEASIEVTQALGFDQTTKVINQGDIKAHDLTLFGKQTTQGGDIRVSNLEITGGGEFKNLGDIEVEQGLTLEIDYFTNEGNLSTDVINGHQHLRCLSNYAKASFKVRDGPLDLAETTLIGNLGIIEAKSLSLHTGKTTLYQSGTLKASNITLTGDNPLLPTLVRFLQARSSVLIWLSLLTKTRLCRH